MKGLLAYLPLTPAYVSSHGLGSLAQAQTQNTQVALHDWDADLTQTVVKQSAIVYSPSITFELSGF